MTKITKSQYEHYLSNMYQLMSFDAAYDQLEYLTNSTRGQHIKPGALKSAIIGGRAGRHIRRLDPTRFEVGFNDYSRR